MFSRTWLARPKSHVCDAVETQVVNISVPDKSMDVLGQVRSFFYRVHQFSAALNHV